MDPRIRAALEAALPHLDNPELVSEVSYILMGAPDFYDPSRIKIKRLNNIFYASINGSADEAALSLIRHFYYSTDPYQLLANPKDVMITLTENIIKNYGPENPCSS
jgi:hypothetical protein